MKCPKARGALTAYVAGELSEAHFAALEAHLADCGPCMTEARRARQLRDLLTAAPEMEPSPQFAARVRLAIREVDERAAWMPRWSPIVPRLAWGLALVAMLFIGGTIGLGLAMPPAPVQQAQLSAPEDVLASAFYDMPGDSLSAAYIGPATGEGVGQQ